MFGSKILSIVLLFFNIKLSFNIEITTPYDTLNTTLFYPKNRSVDVFLGAVFPIHSSVSSNDLACGSLESEDGIMPLEALIYSVNQINENEALLPGISIGVLALDSCGSPTVALHQSLKFIKGFISTENANHEQEFKCPGGGIPSYAGGEYDKIFGVIGGQSSSVSIQMANVLRLFKVPQISYRSTSDTLGDRDRYPYFLRTVPTDTNQVEVILEILKYLKVTYASLVYSKTDYGTAGSSELWEKAEGTSVCFASPALYLSLDDKDMVYEAVIDNLLKREKTRVVVLFADLWTAEKLFKAARKRNAKFLWIGTDAWTAHSTALNDYADLIEESIGIQPLTRTLPGFKDYFMELTPQINDWNPWFNEYWQNHFNCDLRDFTCKSKSLRENGHYIDYKWLHFVRDAAYALAHGLHDMWADLCGPQAGFCEEMAHGGHIHGDQLFEYLRNVSFKDSANQTFKFQESGAGTPRYTISTYRKPGISKNPWIPIGQFSYTSKGPHLELFKGSNLPSMPTSSCGQRCAPYQAQVYSNDDYCCWTCQNCTHYQYINETTNFCVSCDKCQEPNKERRGCVHKRQKYMDYNHEWVITSFAFTSLGIISSIFVGIIFWVHIDTPVIKAASRELSFILLGGILLSFSMTFAILSPPSAISCGITRFFMGFAYTVCYAAIVTKTNRIHRIFNKNPSKPQTAKYTSSVSQVVIVVLLVSVEVIINASWLTYYEPDVIELCKVEDEFNTLMCKGMNDFSYIVGFIYPFSLMLFCTVFAIKTRKVSPGAAFWYIATICVTTVLICPGGFNEARYIAFTNYTTCLLWVIFVPLYLSTGSETGIRLVALAMSLSLGAYVQLGCLFIPKVHIVLFKPEKNTRDAIMAQHRSPSIVQIPTGANMDGVDPNVTPFSSPRIVSGDPLGRKGSHGSIRNYAGPNPTFLKDSRGNRDSIPEEDSDHIVY